uniref:ABC3 transporter permease C-terminal domain-containing protein n=1 Tax=Eubacterium plexicaudatum ASF492 TaxID=1235802 RepID=N2AKH8_9FIRM
MVKVENKETLRLLTNRFMKMNRARNIIAMIAITLTSLLFTSLFVGSTSMILSKRAAEIKQFMDSAHASAQSLSEEDAARLQQTIERSEQVERYGTGIFLGAGMDEHFGFSVEVRYADENMAESFNCLPTTGRLPKKENEIAVGSVVLEALDIEAKIGEEVTITWEVNPVLKKYRTDTFQVCGLWQGDKAVLGQIIWVAESYAKENRYHVTQEELENGIYNGSKEYSVWYKNLWNMEKKTENLSKAAGFTKAGTGMQVNPAYSLVEEDSFSVSSFLWMILFVILAGYLIIYNIFHISVKTDIRAYGLLKNVGTTGKQLKKIVRMQVWRLSAIGIPIGLLCGYIAGLCMAPSLTANGEISAKAGQNAQTVVSANPFIFLVAALLTLLTVYISSLQACKIVEMVSPVEALRLAEGEQSQRKIKRNTSVSWWRMALQNVFRNRKKGFIVMLSIALSMVVVNCIMMLVQGYDFDSYRKIFLASDFQLDQMTNSLYNTNFKGITPQMKEVLNQCPESDKTGYVYYSEETHMMEPTLLEKWKTLADKYRENWSDYEKQIWEDAKASNTISVHFLGISEAVFDKLEWRGEKCSWDTFKSGNYAIVDYGDKYAEHPISYYQKGDLFQMEYTNGRRKEYKIMGEALMPYSLDYPYADLIYITVLVPEEEYMTQTGNESAMYAAIDAKKGKDRQIKEYIDKNILKENDMLNVFSVLDMKESFQRFISKYYVIGGFLVIILAFIGIMNFFNTTATSVISRKKELALLEVVGMTKKQLSKMLVAEGCIYLGGALIIAIMLTVFGAEKILTKTIGRAFFFRIHLTIVPCLLMIPILLGIAYIIPKYQFEKMSRESVVDRIRME